MRNIKIVLVLLLLWSGASESIAQIWAGTFNSSFGELRLIEETWPNGRAIVYGDYRADGTIFGDMGNGGRELTGSFFNVSWNGKLFFDRSFVLTGSRQSENFNFSGFWGRENDNKNSSRPADKWDGNRINILTIGRIRAAIWSGRWDTNFGPIYLEQIGNEITGNYGNGHRVEGTYDPRDRKLRGKFIQGGRVGSFEFTISSNDFSGIWGWGASLNEGAWNGIKFTKSNVNMPPLSNASSNPSLAGRYRVRIEALNIALMTGVFTPDRDIAGELIIRMMGKSTPTSPFTEIRPRDGRNTRVWSAPNNNPLHITQSTPLKISTIRGANNQIEQSISYAGRHVIDRILEFDITSQMATNDLELQILSKITSIGTISNQVLPDAQLKVKISELVPGKTYYILNSEQSSNLQQAFFTFTIQKL